MDPTMTLPALSSVSVKPGRYNDNKAAQEEAHKLTVFSGLTQLDDSFFSTSVNDQDGKPCASPSQGHSSLHFLIALTYQLLIAPTGLKELFWTRTRISHAGLCECTFDK